MKCASFWDAETSEPKIAEFKPGFLLEFIDIEDEMVDLTGFKVNQSIDVTIGGSCAVFYEDSMILYEHELPESVVRSCRGKLVGEVIAHPYLERIYPADARIKQAINNEYGLRIDLDQSSPLFVE